jgi:hypothetical protein
MSEVAPVLNEVINVTDFMTPEEFTRITTPTTVLFTGPDLRPPTKQEAKQLRKLKREEREKQAFASKMIKARTRGWLNK